MLSVILLSLFGTVMVFSAGQAYAYARYGDGYYFVKKQIIWLLLGFAVMHLASRIDIDLYKKYTPHLYVFTLLLLILVLVVGFVGNGAQRWISIGPLTIQPSEIAKLSLVMMLARYFSDYEGKATEKKSGRVALIYGTLIPSLIMLIPIILVMLQKHLSCIIILGAIGLILIFTAGVNPKYISIFCAFCVAAVTYLALFTDYTKDRITVWQNPEAYKLTGGWQTLQGLMAIGSGGIFGVGLGKSILKHCYVSEPANDMIFAILCEELGFVGAAVAMLLFGFLIYRGTLVAIRSSDTYTRLVALGICIKMGVQVLLNIAVVTNTIPNTGISLPFFSYGGSSLVMLFFEMGVILSISRKSSVTK
ncbi:MAG: cell division protein FtsW [Clostridia bacterium]|nr:cell division protein FtsW [Clostridia bacterium]